ncbi:hypothetical protein GCM10023196_054530 [Actinoallomurus vinaceus]|uniref:Lipoprotein n=1 Tax=Actinoallomurus vinaceus TaxID=1080074 RepID=A0ABP8UEF2_9ACTN
MRRKAVAALILAPALTLGSAACGTGHKKVDAKASAASDVQKMRAYAKCMRENGVDMADPETDGNGGIRIRAKGPANGGSAKPAMGDDKTMKAAQAKCGHLMPNGGKPIKPKPEELAKMRAYAKCMRQHGVNMPDPNSDGGITVKSGGGKSNNVGAGDVNPDSQAFKDADKACANYRPGGSRSLTRSAN